MTDALNHYSEGDLYAAPALLVLAMAVLPVNKSILFQAEDGIRDIGVTGVQTCALPISDADTGAHGLGERRRVDDGARTVHGEHRGQRLAAEADVDVRVVLEEHEAAVAGHVQQDRKRVVEGKRVDLGGRRIIK